MATTKLSQAVGAPTSQYRIQCNSSTVLIGDREFLSATEALEAYLGQYENQGFSKTKPYKRTVNDLLNPKSALRLTAERSLETGVRGTVSELQLADAKDAINDSLHNMKKSLALKADVEEALNKSQELIKHINMDDYPNKGQCPSDVGSLNTDILVSMNPDEGYKDPGGSEGIPTWKSKHVFGYKRPRSRRAKTMSSIQISHDLMALVNDQPPQTFVGQPTDKTSPHVTFQGGNISTSPPKNDLGHYDDDVSLLLGQSPNNTRPSRSPLKKLHERSRSVSPSILKHERKLFESGLRDKPIPDYYTDFNTSTYNTPSWIDTMNTSDVSDTDWNKRDFTTSRPPPSWINDIDNSDITSVVSAPKPTKKLQLHDLLRPLPVINAQDSSLSSDLNDTLPPPGLTYRDLVGDMSKLSNTQSKASPDSPTISEKLTDLKSKTNAALGRYHDRLQNDFDTPSKGSNPYSGDLPRCSSMDAAALRAGIPPPGKSDITGASPVCRGDNDSMIAGFRSPGKSSRRPHSPDTDIVLEGDRPWEKTASFKPPVSVQDISMQGTSGNQLTYSGGSQPGSLECLKKMIFKLQQEAVHTDSEDEGSRVKLSERVHRLRAEAANLGKAVPNTEKGDKAPGDIPALKGYNFKAEPGGQSLEKALTHLDRLKTLVNNTQQQQGSESQKGASGVIPLCAHMEN